MNSIEVTMTRAICIGGPAAGSAYETTGRDLLIVAIAWEPLRLDVCDPKNPAAPGSFTYRIARIRCDGIEHRFWIPADTPREGEAHFILGSLIGGYRAPGCR